VVRFWTGQICRRTRPEFRPTQWIIAALSFPAVTLLAVSSPRNNTFLNSSTCPRDYANLKFPKK
jgi:hypothetical protein